MNIIYFIIGGFVLFWMGFFLRHWLFRMSSYSGIITVTKTKEKTLYSLEVENVDDFDYKKEVVFQIVHKSDVDS